MALLAVFMLLSVVVASAVWVLRTTIVMRANTPVFTLMILLGANTAFVAVLCYILGVRDEDKCDLPM